MPKTRAMLPIIVSRVTSSSGRLYGIIYYDVAGQKWHLGYTSNRLDITQGYLRTEFDIVPLDLGEVDLFANKAITAFIMNVFEGGVIECAM